MAHSVADTPGTLSNTTHTATSAVTVYPTHQNTSLVLSDTGLYFIIVSKSYDRKKR